MRVFFLWKCSKFDVNLKNIENNWQKSFCLRDKCIWIGCVKLPLLRREYLSSAVNVLTNNLQIFHVTKRDSFQLSYLHSDQWIWESCCHWDSNRVLARLPRCLSRSPLKRDFLGIYLTTSLGVRYFRDTSAMRVIFFFWKGSKFDADMKNAQNSSENVFCFWGKSIWIGCIKLSLLRREYLSSDVAVLTNSLKTLHVTKSDFFELNFRHIDKWIW